MISLPRAHSIDIIVLWGKIVSAREELNGFYIAGGGRMTQLPNNLMNGMGSNLNILHLSQVTILTDFIRADRPWQKRA